VWVGWGRGEGDEEEEEEEEEGSFFLCPSKQLIGLHAHVQRKRWPASVGEPPHTVTRKKLNSPALGGALEKRFNEPNRHPHTYEPTYDCVCRRRYNVRV
jgi:hypothetical protein